MNGQFLLPERKGNPDYNIYADKSSLILEWLLFEGINQIKFSIREVSRKIPVSIGLIQKVFLLLVKRGIVETKGVRTSKRFIFKKPEQLLTEWLKNYSLVKKCKTHAYHTALPNRDHLLKTLQQSNVCQKIKLALHSAAQAHSSKNTNLQTLELYLLQPNIREELEKILLLETQEKGYEVLLIEPYYKSMACSNTSLLGEQILPTSPLLTFLDLYHFPLRGLEQAEFMALRIKELKRIYKRV